MQYFRTRRTMRNDLQRVTIMTPYVNYSRCECGSLQLIALCGSNCRVIRTDVSPVMLTAAIKRAIKRTYRIQSSRYIRDIYVIRDKLYGCRNSQKTPIFTSRN